MPDVATVHDGIESYREVTTDDEIHRFRITGDEGDRSGYEYEGDGDPPETVVDALENWIQELHGSTEDNDGTAGGVEE